MRIAMDSDCLIKLTKVSAKETLARSHEVLISDEVRAETAGDRVSGVHPDSAVIRENLKTGRIKLERADPGSLEGSELGLDHLGPGERSVLSIYVAGGADIVASDDRRLQRLLGATGVPGATTTSLLVLLARSGALGREEAMGKLRSLRGMVSPQQLRRALASVEGG